MIPTLRIGPDSRGLRTRKADLLAQAERDRAAVGAMRLERDEKPAALKTVETARRRRRPGELTPRHSLLDIEREA